MQTQSSTKFATVNANIAELPILKHFDSSEIATKVDTFRKGEKNLFWFLKLGAICAIGYALWVYVLPPIFKAIGAALAGVATAVIVLLAAVCAPAIFKGCRALARQIHKRVIKWDPFAQLAIERQKMVQNQAIFRVAKGKIGNLKSDMENESVKAEKDAKDGQTKILQRQGKAAKIKEAMDAMLKEKGVKAKEEDEYVNYAAEYQTVLAEAQRIINQTAQAKDFVTKYGSRAAIMKKLNQKLVMVETAMSIKLADFDATIDMLKKDYEFGQKANAATSAAKSALGFSKGWEMDYALDVVTSTISADIAMTAGNLKDIDTLASNYTLDSDELFANLNAVADKIKVGGDEIPQAKQYNNPDYQLTGADKRAAGGFQEIF